MKSFISALLILCFLTLSSPAAPKILVDGSAQVHQNVKIAFFTSGWYDSVVQSLRRYFSEPQTPTQETQEMRDAQVVDFETYFNSTYVIGESVELGAIPIDINNVPVSGVKVSWEIQTPSGENINDLKGFYKFEEAGQYTITVKGAGKNHSSTVVVNELSSEIKNDPRNSKHSDNQENLLPIDEWNPTNIEYAREARNQRGEVPGIPKENSNFSIKAPVLSIAGRVDLDLNLGLSYNSRVWTKMGQDVSYDIDKDNVAPGWNIGFGKIISFLTNSGSNQGIVQYDETGRKRFFTGKAKTDSYSKTFEGQSTDGSFIKVKHTISGRNTNGQVCFGSEGFKLKYPNGTTVEYIALGNAQTSCIVPGTPITYVPYKIYNKHDSSITISYWGSDSNQTGKFINFITDSLGRIYKFNYTQISGRYYLTSISGPGLKDNGTVTERTFVRLNYKDHVLAYNFGNLNPKVRDSNNNIKVLSSVYYPSTNTGYWFGASDSYSPYGMIRKVEEYKGMSFDSSTGNISVTGQTATRRRIYSYPENTATSLTDIPDYSTVTETWDGMPDPNSPAITEYTVNWNTTPQIPRTTTVKLPYDQGKTTEYSYNDPGSPLDGMTYRSEFYDKNNVLRSKDETAWGVATLDFSVFNNTQIYTMAVIRPNNISHTEINNGVSLTKQSVYDLYGQYNRVEEMHEVGFNGETLRRTKTQYIDKNDSFLQDSDWGKARVTNLPTIVEVFDGNNNRIDYTQYRYDFVPVLNYCPPNSNCSPSLNREIGNLTNIIKYSTVTNSTLSGMFNDGRYYDVYGNIIDYSPSPLGINEMNRPYTSATNYAYPEFTSYGNGGTGSIYGIRTDYDYNTGLLLLSTDPNNQQTTFDYELYTWRLKKVLSPTGAYAITNYDDLNQSQSQTLYDSSGVVVSKEITRLNSLGLQYRQETLSGTNQNEEVYDVTETLYSNSGRAEKVSNSFRSNENAHGVYWNQAFYDELGRVWKTKKADGSEKFTYYDETSRPNAATSGLGHSVRIQDPTGRQKWYRTDSDGNVAEVVEPNPDGDGSVGTNGLLTKYYYDRLGRLLRTEQGVQERKFRYDALGRITHQKMAETKATLDDSGVFVGESSGLWSDYFTYDDNSNISTATDARGVKTKYSYQNPAQTGYYPPTPVDGLNRIYSISYETTGTTNVLPSSTIKFEYYAQTLGATGNKLLANKIYSENIVNGNPQKVVTNELNHDAFGRLIQKKTKLESRADFPMTTNYSYDSLNRVTDIFYPEQYGTGSVRKNIHNDYDSVGRAKALKVNGVNYASDFVYNNFDQVTSVKIGPSGSNQITETYNYNPVNGLLINQKVMKSGSALLDLSYEYQQCSCSTGGSDQITKIINNLDRNKDRKYEYDALSRLKKVTGGVNQGWSQSYSYDRYGNRSGVSSLGFEALRSSEQANKSKDEQEKILKESVPTAAVLTKESILENVQNIVKDKIDDGTSQSPLFLYKETEEINDKFNNINDQSLSPTNKSSENQTKPSINNQKDTENENSLTTPGTPFDFDGDGKADFSTWQRNNGNWSVYNRQTAQNDALQLGSSGNQIAPGDYDGDGKTDRAVWNPETGMWTVKYSSNGNIITVQWGAKGDAIVPADYDGDGKTDLAVWRPNTGGWYITKSSDGTWYGVTFGGQQFGDIPSVGDYDGDGKADISVWRPANGDWYVFILQSSNSQVIQPHWGQTGDVPVPADYDGDHKTDLAVWRPSNSSWYVSQSSNGQFVQTVMGSEAAKDVLAPADYDGDGKADVAIWNPASGNWTVKQTTTGTTVTHQLGNNADVAVPSAYIRRSSSPRGQSVQVPRDGHETLSFDSTSNRITTSGFEYDLAGNQTKIVKPDGTIQRFQYDAAGRLIKVKNDNNQTLTTYTYGIGRERLVTQEGDENSTNLTYYAWEGGAVISEYVETASNFLLWTKNYIYMGGNLLATQDRTVNGETVQFNHPDYLGTRVITDPSTGASFEQANLPYGTALDSETTGSSNRRFTSYDRSYTTGLDYANNRFYDSTQGRFTTVDPIKMSSVKILNPQTMNLYSYTSNDPVNRTDPSGLDWNNGGIYTSTFPWGFPSTGGTGTSQQPIWAQILGAFANFLGGRNNYNYIGMSLGYGPMESSRNVIVAPPPLPGAGTIQAINSSSFSNVKDPTPCSRMANIVDGIIRRGIREMGGMSVFKSQFHSGLDGFLRGLDEILSGIYVGRPLNSNYNALALSPYGEGPTIQTAPYGGSSGFKPEFIENPNNLDNDQTHHFVTYFSGGLNNKSFTIAYHKWKDDNDPDKLLGQAAYDLGQSLRMVGGLSIGTFGEPTIIPEEGTGGRMDRILGIADRIRNEICQ